MECGVFLSWIYTGGVSRRTESKGHHECRVVHGTRCPPSRGGSTDVAQNLDGTGMQHLLTCAWMQSPWLAQESAPIDLCRDATRQNNPQRSTHAVSTPGRRASVVNHQSDAVVRVASRPILQRHTRRSDTISAATTLCPERGARQWNRGCPGPRDAHRWCCSPGGDSRVTDPCRAGSPGARSGWADCA